jgi:hypothetical protein
VAQLFSLGGIERMTKFLKIAGVVMVANMQCFWISYAILKAQDANMWAFKFLGWWRPTSAPSHLAQWAFMIFSAPSSMLPAHIYGGYHPVIWIFCSALNSAVWGICLGFPIYEFTKRFRHGAAA